MSEFKCVTCGKAFSIKKETLEKFPGWAPKYCWDCSPKNKAKGGGAGGSGAKAAKKRRSRPPRTATKEENLRVAEVLSRYTGGPATGVFTDGACTPNPGPGGWGVVWVRDGEVLEQRYGHDADTTNNRMEMTAIIEAMRLLPADTDETVFTDSKLCQQTLEEWAKGWEKNGWKRKAGPIKNLELVQEAWALRQERPRLKIEHISAHAGNRWNEYADSLATAWMRDEL